MDIFSKKFYRKNFFFLCLKFAKDRVNNVRGKYCRLLEILLVKYNKQDYIDEHMMLIESLTFLKDDLD
jgi:hypothetical protein